MVVSRRVVLLVSDGLDVSRGFDASTAINSIDLQRAVREDGYSLVEVLVAIAILSLAILPMGGMFDAALRAGRSHDVLPHARALVSESPLRERRWALLALAQYQAGRQAESLRTLREVRTVLATELGTKWRTRLVEFEEDPAAAASIGQVHRARWADGRAVAVKVQYPGAGDALMAFICDVSRVGI